MPKIYISQETHDRLIKIMEEKKKEVSGILGVDTSLFSHNSIISYILDIYGSHK